MSAPEHKLVTLARVAARLLADGDMPGYVHALCLLAVECATEAQYIRDVLTTEVEA